MINDRNKAVLTAVVQCYINKPGPVGSRYVARKFGFNLSSATIRNVMADLEEMGYLMQPHTSAGRVPTDKGFRFYVDSLDREGGVEEDALVGFLEERIEALRSDINDLLMEVTRALATISNYLVFAVPVASDKTTLNRIQLYQYRRSKLAAVILSNEGLVKNKILGSNFGLSQMELNRISDFLNSEFSGWTIDDIRAEILRQMSREKAIADVLISKALAICNEVLKFPMEDMIVSGFTELLGLPEFSDRINEVAKAIEDKQRIVRLLDEVASGTDDVQVVIGSEIPMEQMRGLSIISAAYKQDDRSLGRVGMIGPTRMDYHTAICLVDRTARLITSALSDK